MFHHSPRQSQLHFRYHRCKWELRYTSSDILHYRFLYSPWQIFNLQTLLLQSSPLLHLNPSAHFFVGRQLPPQSTSVSFPFLIWSLQVEATIDNLRFSTFQFLITTLTEIGCTDTANTIIGITATHEISAFFLRCTPSATVYTSLFRIHDSIVASGNYKGEAHILNVWSGFTHLDKYLIYRHRWYSLVH